MVEEQSLRWSSHRDHLMDYIDSLQNGESFVDVTLVCDELALRAHRVVLSASSSYLENLLAENPAEDPVIILHGIEGRQLRYIVDFMYRGEIRVDPESVDSLVEVADMLQIRGLSRTTIGSFPREIGYDTDRISATPSKILRTTDTAMLLDYNGEIRASPIPRRKQARPRRRSGDSDPCSEDLSRYSESLQEGSRSNQEAPEDLSMKKSPLSAMQSIEEKHLYPATQADTFVLPNLSETESIKSESNSSGSRTPITSHLTTSPLPLHQDRRKGQHSAPRGGPPRAWTNADLTEALNNVWNRKMTTSQASRVFGIPYNSLLMYVRGKYGKSLKLDALRKETLEGEAMALAASTRGSYKLSGCNNNNNNNNTIQNKMNSNPATPVESLKDLRHSSPQPAFPMPNLSTLTGFTNLGINPYFNYLCDFSLPVPVMNLLSNKLVASKTARSESPVPQIDVIQH